MQIESLLHAFPAGQTLLALLDVPADEGKHDCRGSKKKMPKTPISEL